MTYQLTDKTNRTRQHTRFRTKEEVVIEEEEEEEEEKNSHTDPSLIIADKFIHSSRGAQRSLPGSKPAQSPPSRS